MPSVVVVEDVLGIQLVHSGTLFGPKINPRQTMINPEQPMGNLGAVLGRLGSSWVVLGPSWGRYCRAQGPAYTQDLNFDDSFTFLTLFHRKTLKKHSSWGHLGPSWGRLGVVLGPSWGVLELSWGCLGDVLGCLGPS